MADVFVRILVDGVVHDGAGGTYSAGAVVPASAAQAASLVASGFAEGAPARVTDGGHAPDAALVQPIHSPTRRGRR